LLLENAFKPLAEIVPSKVSIPLTVKWSAPPPAPPEPEVLPPRPPGLLGLNAESWAFPPTAPKPLPPYPACAPPPAPADENAPIPSVELVLAPSTDSVPPAAKVALLVTFMVTFWPSSNEALLPRVKLLRNMDDSVATTEPLLMVTSESVGAELSQSVIAPGS